MLERGDICWTPLPGLGRRPVLVLSSRAVSMALYPIVASITSVERPRPIPTAVALADDEVPALYRDSWILCHDLHTLTDGAPLERVGRLSPRRMLDVEAALRFTRGLG